MLNGYFNVTVVEEWITFFAALLLLDKRTGVWRLFKILFAFILIAETTGWHLRTQGHQHENAIPFNVLMLLTDSFLIWFFAITKWFEKERKILFVSIAAFLMFWIVNILFFQGMWDYNFYSETFVDIILFIICSLFYYKLLQSDEHVNLFKLDYFWLATGVLFSSLGSALLYQFSALFNEYYNNTKIDLGTYINYGLNSILYVCIVISFICRRKATRSPQP